ncbi:MAG: acyltransferase family protein [Flavobacteriales bacterium]
MAILKGIGILLIFLHNYFHWQPGMGIENEFAFKASGAKALLAHVLDGPVDLLRYFFAYFGHFGVQLFVLTSGYGLAVSARSGRTSSYVDYLFPKLIKILALLLIGAVFISIVRYINDGHAFNIGVVLEIIIGRMTSVWNFSGSTIFRYSGPFWFFGLIVQLYVLFPLMNKLLDFFSARSAGMLLVALLVLNAWLYPICERIDLPLMGIFIGHLPVFLLGALLARDGAYLPKGSVVAALVIFLLGQFHPAFFMATFISAAMIMLFLYQAVRRNGPSLIGRWVGGALQWVGGISMAIFIINGPLRSLALFRNAEGDLLTSKVLLFTVILFALAMPTAYAFKKLSAGLQMAYDRVVGGLRRRM